MPQISARMSASSSTTRMSCAMRALPFDALGFAGIGDARIAAQEQQRHACAAAAAIFEAQLAAMVFHDLLDDRQTETGAAGARGDVWLSQAIALLMRQADAVVLDRNGDGAIGVGHTDADVAGCRSGAAR